MTRERSARYHFTVGSFDCIALSDGAQTYSWETFFDNAPSGILEQLLAERRISDDGVQLESSCLLVATGAHRVLIDTGRWHPARANSIRRSLRQAGITRESIDTVV